MSSERKILSRNDDSENSENQERNTSGDFLKNSEFLANLQREVSLPPDVKKRVHALKNLQLQITNLEARFYQEVHLLECKYNTLFNPIHEKRFQIISGAYEPTAEESEWKLGLESNELSEELKSKIQLDKDEDTQNDHSINSTTNVVGIPTFWLTAFKNISMISEMIQPHDEPILAHLINVKVVMLQENPMGFVLEFYFSPNDYFTNSVLTKEYEMKCIPDPCDPLSFEGPEIVRCKGCKIDWKKGKNVTLRFVKKKQKHKSKGAVRTVLKTVQNESFFNFFNPPEVPDDSETENFEETQALLTSDFEIGDIIRERVVPRAVLFFTGEEMTDDDFDDVEEEEEEEEDLNDDSNDADSEEEAPKNVIENNKRKGRSSNKTQNAAEEGVNKTANPSECKQQ